MGPEPCTLEQGQCCLHCLEQLLGLSVLLLHGRLDTSRRLCWHLRSEPHSAICPSLIGTHQSLMQCLTLSLPSWPRDSMWMPRVTLSLAIGCPLCWVELMSGPQSHIWWHLPYEDGMSVKGLCCLLFFRTIMRTPGQDSIFPASLC